MSAQIALEAAWRVPALRYGPRRWRHWRRSRHLPIHWYMKAEQLAVVQGWDDTRATLRRWNANPLAHRSSWALGSLAVTATLLI